MKRMSPVPRSESLSRRGTLFHYYMVYLFLSSILMITAGLCLHAILKADQLDSQIALDLNSLTRLEEQFRADALDFKLRESDGDSLTFAQGDLLTDWSVQGRRVVRIQNRADEIVSKDQFLFSKGTRIELLNDTSTALCRITEAPIMPDSYKATAEQIRAVEIVAIVRMSSATSGAGK